MAELSTVARPYAEALFAAARDDKAGLPAWADLVGQLSQVAANPDVREAMADPRLGDKQRIELFSGLIKAELPQAARNFIELLVQNDRLLLLPSSLRNSKRCGIVTTARRRRKSPARSNSAKPRSKNWLPRSSKNSASSSSPASPSISR